ncbi:MAG: hypothetical protein ACXVFL_15365 [Solirubrobacteraceae bacterium]
MSGVRAYAAAFAGVLALAAPAAARIAPAAGKVSPDRPWATVNICDTQAHPDAIGVRGSMPGLRTRRTHMYLRIRMQFQQADRTWADLGAAGDSGWLDAGKSRSRVRQVGRTFTIVPPQTGQAPYVLRARVAFEWRRGAVVYRRAQVFTTAGHHGVAGGDPPGFSAALCRIT